MVEEERLYFNCKITLFLDVTSLSFSFFTISLMGTIPFCPHEFVQIDLQTSFFLSWIYKFSPILCPDWSAYNCKFHAHWLTKLEVLIMDSTSSIGYNKAQVSSSIQSYLYRYLSLGHPSTTALLTFQHCFLSLVCLWVELRENREVKFGLRLAIGRVISRRW